MALKYMYNESVDLRSAKISSYLTLEPTLRD